VCLNASYHKPVLLSEVLDALDLRPNCVYCDATLGDGGHSMAILQQLPATGKVVGIDRDAQAIERAQHRLAPFADRFQPIQGNFSEIDKLLQRLDIAKVDGIVCDLGVSMLQITDPGRGFMYSADGPLNMRMQGGEGLTAADVVNDFSGKELEDIFWKYGQERQSRRIVRALVRERKKYKIETTAQLADIIRSVVGERFIIKTLARIFQAIRIYINDELGSLERFLAQVPDVLNSNGRLAIIEYHSLEARLIKDFIYRETHPCTCPRELPQCVCGKTPRIKIVHRRIKPSDAEISNNPNSRSARLRVIEKL